MSLYWPLSALVGNDTNFTLNVTFNGAILDLTAFTPKAYLKASATALDSSGRTYLVGTGLTVSNAKLGKIRWTIPHADLTTPGTQWWRLDIVDGNGAIYTCLYGPMIVKAA